MKDILNKLDWLGFDNYSQALIAFYREPFEYDGLKYISPWDFSELTEWELNILKLNYQTINN